MINNKGIYFKIGAFLSVIFIFASVYYIRISSGSKETVQQITQAELIHSEALGVYQTEKEWSYEFSNSLQNESIQIASERKAWINGTECSNNICRITISAASSAPSIDITAVQILGKLNKAEWNKFEPGQIKMLSMDKKSEPNQFVLAIGRYKDTLSSQEKSSP